MDILAQRANEVKQVMNNQSSPQLQQVLQGIQKLAGSQNQSVNATRDQMAQLESSIQSSIDSLEGVAGTEQMRQALNNLQVELMNWSQDMEQQQLNKQG